MNGEHPMSRMLACVAFGLALLVAPGAFAGERTITLAVQNMYCANCPVVVRKSLEAVPGVARAVVSYKDKTAIVSYEDTKTDVKSLTTATTNAGYLSAPKS
jgi:periplasmic mercuric ion binding protein